MCVYICFMPTYIFSLSFSQKFIDALLCYFICTFCLYACCVCHTHESTKEGKNLQYINFFFKKKKNLIFKNICFFFNFRKQRKNSNHGLLQQSYSLPGAVFQFCLDQQQMYATYILCFICFFIILLLIIFFHYNNVIYFFRTIF